LTPIIIVAAGNQRGVGVTRKLRERLADHVIAAVEGAHDDDRAAVVRSGPLDPVATREPVAVAPGDAPAPAPAGQCRGLEVDALAVLPGGVAGQRDRLAL